MVASAGSAWTDLPSELRQAAAVAHDVPGRPRRRGILWADLMRRTFGIDVLECPRCGRRLRLIALIDEARVVERILRHLGLPTDRPEPRPARSPPSAVLDPESPLIPRFDATF